MRSCRIYRGRGLVCVRACMGSGRMAVLLMVVYGGCGPRLGGHCMHTCSHSTAHSFAVLHVLHRLFDAGLQITSRRK